MAPVVRKIFQWIADGVSVTEAAKRLNEAHILAPGRYLASVDIIKNQKHVKLKRGEYQSKTCPYGYQKSEGGRMEPDPEIAPIMRFIFEIAVQTGTTTAIIKALFE